MRHLAPCAEAVHVLCGRCMSSVPAFALTGTSLNSVKLPQWPEKVRHSGVAWVPSCSLALRHLPASGSAQATLASTTLEVLLLILTVLDYRIFGPVPP